MPERLNAAEAIEWSREKGIVCADESLLETAPYAGRVEWCHARVAATERRLATVPPETPLIILNHFPLRNEFAYLPRIPSFTIWCGTRKTENWHTRFPVHTAVSGHIHWRRDERRDGVRFVECSLGYPRDWLGSGRPVDDYLVEILPGPG